MRRSSQIAFYAVLALVVPACSTTGLNFRTDERVTITSPDDRAKVTLPLTVSWSTTDFEVTGRDGRARDDAGYFGVYVDRAPQPPGRTQEWLAREDERCLSEPGCPDREYLAERWVHSTTKTRFEIERLAAPSPEAPKRREFHEVTIVLLDGKGARIGESAFTVQFEVDREG